MLFDEQVKIILESWGVTLPEKNIVYVSGPMTTGRETISFDFDVVDDNFEKNCQAMRDLANNLRIENSGVIDPSGLEMPCWGQWEYMSFWLRCIEEKVSKIYFVDGWQYSSGCLQEMQKAIELKIPMFNSKGYDLSLSALLGIVDSAHAFVDQQNSLTRKGELVKAQLEKSKTLLESFFR